MASMNSKKVNDKQKEKKKKKKEKNLQKIELEKPLEPLTLFINQI